MASENEQHWRMVGSAYDTFAESEDARLRGAANLLEFEFGKFLIRRYAAGASRVIDLGSGPGVYALWLAGMGLSVRLVDVSERSLRLAEYLAARAGLRAQISTRCGDAADISVEPSRGYDLALALGPIYHAPNEVYVNRLLQQIKRVLTDQGVLVANIANAYYMLTRICAAESPSQCKLLLEEVKAKGFVLYRGENDDIGCWICTRQYMESALRRTGFAILHCGGTKAILQGQDTLITRASDSDRSALQDLMIASASMPEYIDCSEYVWFAARNDGPPART